MNVSVIYVSWNSASEILESIETLKQQTGALAYEIIIVDNASPEGCERLIRPDIHLVRSARNGGFGAGCNLGAEYAKGDYLLFLNPDTRLRNDVLSALMDFLEKRRDAGAAGPLTLDENGSIMFEAGRSLPTLLNEFLEHSTLAFRFAQRSWAAKPYLSRWDHRSTKQVEALLGACMMVRRDCFERLHGFDENFFLYSEEFDLCKRIRDIGFEVWYVHTARLLHKGKTSTLQRFGDVNRMVLQYLKSQHYYLRKHEGPVTAAMWRCMIAALYLVRFTVSRQAAFLDFCKWGAGLV
jgi:GT2 family glycosyltransferase